MKGNNINYFQDTCLFEKTTGVSDPEQVFVPGTIWGTHDYGFPKGDETSNLGAVRTLRKAAVCSLVDSIKTRPARRDGACIYVRKILKETACDHEMNLNGLPYV